MYRMPAKLLEAIPEIRPEDPDLAVRLASADERTELDEERAQNSRQAEIAAHFIIQNAMEQN